MLFLLLIVPEALFSARDGVHPHSVVLTRDQTGAFQSHPWLLRCSGTSALPLSGGPSAHHHPCL